MTPKRLFGVGATITAVALGMAFAAPLASAQDADIVDEAIVVAEDAVAGGGGIAEASADGGVIIIGDLNSGLNVGNVISVGVLE